MTAEYVSAFVDQSGLSRPVGARRGLARPVARTDLPQQKSYRNPVNEPAQTRTIRNEKG